MTDARTEIGTNVRKSGLPWAVGLALWVGATVAPSWTAERAIDRFLATSRRPASARQAEFRASGERIVVDAGGDAVIARAWGAGPLVYLLHGWNGSVTDFRHLVPALVEAGYRAVAVDAAGHGETAGDSGSAVHLARGLVALADAFGPAAAVVAHSLGGAAAAYAVAQGAVSTDRLVLLGPVTDPGRYVGLVAGDVGPAFVARLLRTLESRVGVPAADLALAASARSIGVPVLVVHDTGDEETPLRAVARATRGWDSVRLVTTDGLGHRKVLSDPDVVRAIVSTLRGTNVRVCSHARLPTTCAACALEHDLFHRESRAA